MTRHRVGRLARPLALAAIALTTAYLLVGAVPQMRGDAALDQLSQLAAPWYLVPGAIVVLRRDGHIIGWLLVASALLSAIMLSAEVAGAGTAWMATAWRVWVIEWIGSALWTVTLALFVLFPDGLSERSRRQRRVGWATLATASFATVAALFLTEVGDESIYGVHANPTGLGFVPSAVGDVLITPIIVGGLSSVIGLWRRARRVTGAQRRQYTLVLFAFAVVIAGLVFALISLAVLGEAAGDSGPMRLIWLPVIIGWFLIPTAFTIAILRHRLYDIDQIISRTVSYVLLSGVLVSVYVAGVLLLSRVLAPVGAGSDLAVAVGTLAAAAVFRPARRRIQGAVDRRFNRRRYDAARTIDAFTARLRHDVDLDSLGSELVEVVARTTEPASVSLWLRDPAGRR
jgi:hypothetical protein